MLGLLGLKGLDKLLSLFGLFKSGKTVTGIIGTLLGLLQMINPEIGSLILGFLQQVLDHSMTIGLPLVAVGLSHKRVKSLIKAEDAK